jgi:hypothetical protein
VDGYFSLHIGFAVVRAFHIIAPGSDLLRVDPFNVHGDGVWSYASGKAGS